MSRFAGSRGPDGGSLDCTGVITCVLTFCIAHTKALLYVASPWSLFFFCAVEINHRHDALHTTRRISAWVIQFLSIVHGLFVGNGTDLLLVRDSWLNSWQAIRGLRVQMSAPSIVRLSMAGLTASGCFS